MTWKASALSMLDPFGTLTFRRIGTPNVDITVRARIRGYRADELVGGIQQGDRQVVAYADDVTFTPALRAGDKVLSPTGRLLNIETVDDSTGLTDEGLVVYYLRVRG
jgi:hypothetical protein